MSVRERERFSKRSNTNLVPDKAGETCRSKCERRRIERRDLRIVRKFRTKRVPFTV